jgi:hypothetical protein
VNTQLEYNVVSIFLNLNIMLLIIGIAIIPTVEKMPSRRNFLSSVDDLANDMMKLNLGPPVRVHRLPRPHIPLGPAIRVRNERQPPSIKRKHRAGKRKNWRCRRRQLGAHNRVVPRAKTKLFN